MKSNIIELNINFLILVGFNNYIQSIMQNMNMQIQSMNQNLNNNMGQNLNLNMNNVIPNNNSFMNNNFMQVNSGGGNSVSTSVSYDPINRESVITTNRNGSITVHRIRDGENSQIQINQLINSGFVPNQEMIETLPEREILQSDIENSNDQNSCIICLSQFQVKDKVITLPCLHIFHSECIKKWLNSRDDCPICKHNIND